MEELSPYTKAALAALAGAGDEMSFGLEGKYLPTLKKLMEENPKSATAGRVGSYFVPVMGELEALRGAARAGEGLNVLKSAGKLLPRAQNVLQHGAASLAERLPFLASREGEGALAGILRGAGRGAASGVAASEGNKKIRGLVGTDEAGADAPGIEGEALAGGLGGAGGHFLGNVAQNIYSHPALVNNQAVSESKKLVRGLMDRGVHGGFDTFEGEANRLKRPFQDLMEKIRPKVQGRENQDLAKVRSLLSELGTPESGLPQKGLVNIDNLKNAMEDARKVRLKTAPQPEELDSLENAFNNGREGLQAEGPWNTTNLGAVEDSLHATNTDLSKLRKNPRAAYGSSDPGTGAVANPIENKLDWKRALEDIEERGVQRYGDQGDLSSLKSTRPSYGEGRDLTRNLLDFERMHMSNSPHLSHGWTDKALNATIKSLPVRTGAGILADKAGKGALGALSGELSGLQQRQKNSPTEGGQSFEQYLKGYETKVDGSPADQGNPYLKTLEGNEQGQETGNPYLKYLDE